MLVETDGERVRLIRGDRTIRSPAATCPEGAGLVEFHDDPTGCARRSCARARAGAKSRWDEAFAKAIERVDEVRRATAGTRSPCTRQPRRTQPGSDDCMRSFARARTKSGTRRVRRSDAAVSSRSPCTAGLPIPVPDVDRTDRLLVFGANPVVSNGSLMTAPTCAAASPRSGRAVEDRRRRSAPLRDGEIADEHVHPARKRRVLLAAMVHVIFAEHSSAPVARRIVTASTACRIRRDFPPERVARDRYRRRDERRLAREQATAL